MSSENHIVQFKLDKELIKKLMSSKKFVLDHKKNETTELVLPDTRIKLDVDRKKSPNSKATYYNNKSKDLFYLGKTETATATARKGLIEVDKKRPSSTTAPTKSKTKEDGTREKATSRGIESLDIPSIPVATSPNLKSKSSPITTSTLKKSSATVSHNDKSSTSSVTATSKHSSTNSIKKSTTTKSTSTNNIPLQSTPNRGSTPTIHSGTTPRPTTTASPKINPNDKLSDQVAQLLALRPYQISTLAKILETTQWEVKKALDEVGLNIPEKKKYCLKPLFYDKIKIWNNPAITAEDRQKIIMNAREAYDILRLPSDAIERYNLLDPATRGLRPKPKKSAPPPATTTTTKAPVKKEESGNNKKSSLNKASSSPITKGSNNNHKTSTPSGLSSYNSNGNSRTPPPLSSDSASKSPLGTKQRLPSSSSSSSQQRQQQQQQLLKPSSSNKKQVGAKALPSSQHQHEKLSPPTKRKSSDHVSAAEHASHSAPLTTHYSAHPTSSSSKRMKSSSSLDQSTLAPPPHTSRPLELSNIKTQSKFDKYCLKFISGQKEYQTSKINFKNKFPHYVQALKSTHPPTTGSKRSWFDAKLEYYELVKDNYLKNKEEDQEEWEEATSQLRDCQRKRKRLNYMWSSIEKNIHQHHYKLNHKM